MPLPQMHGRTHVPAGYSVLIEAGDPDTLPVGTSDTLPVKVSSSGGNFPCFRAYAYNTVQTITNNNAGYARFDRWQSSSTSVINSAGWVAGTPDYIDEIDILERGLYAFMFAVIFTPSAAGGEIGFALEDASTTYAEPPQLIQSSANKAGDGSTGAWSWTHIQSFPPIWTGDTGGANQDAAHGPALPKVKISVFNKTGGNITLDTQMLEIHQLRSFDYATIGSVQSQA